MLKKGKKTELMCTWGWGGERGCCLKVVGGRADPRQMLQSGLSVVELLAGGVVGRGYKGAKISTLHVDISGAKIWLQQQWMVGVNTSLLPSKQVSVMTPKSNIPFTSFCISGFVWQGAIEVNGVGRGQWRVETSLWWACMRGREGANRSEQAGSGDHPRIISSLSPPPQMLACVHLVNLILARGPPRILHPREPRLVAAGTLHRARPLEPCPRLCLLCPQ